MFGLSTRSVNQGPLADCPASKTRGSFPNAEAAMKLLYLALEHIAKKWTMPVQNWKAALQRFAILHGERIPRTESV
jgi:transposase-like protein